MASPIGTEYAPSVSMSRVALDSRLVEYQDAPRNGRWRPLPRLPRRSPGGMLAGVLGVFERGQGNGAARQAAPASAIRAMRQWLTEFAACVRGQEFDRARAYFHPDAYCFGSYASACKGLDALVRQQWQKIWPNITGFQFQTRQLRHQISADGRMACAMVPWRSVGYDADGVPFQRNGRVTIVLARASGSEPWRAFHTHYSLNPGTPQTAARSTK